MTKKHREKPEVQAVEEAVEETVEPVQAQPAVPAGHAKKQLALWLAVGGTMAVIVTMWVLLLPMQLSDIRLPSARDLSRWSVVKSAKEQSRTFDENLRAIRQKLNELTQTSQQQAQPAPVNIDIQQLREKLEAASLRNEQLPTNEAKK